MAEPAAGGVGPDAAGPGGLRGVRAAARWVAVEISPFDLHWEVIVQLAVHVQARAFGFQVFNVAPHPTAAPIIPASSALAADHLVHLLRGRVAALTGEGLSASAAETYSRAVADLHDTYFGAAGPFKHWQRWSGAAAAAAASVGSGGGRAKAAEDLPLPPFSSARSAMGVSCALPWVQQLAELALYFLVWSEAATLRQMPELLWLLVHLMLISANHVEACQLLEAPGSLFALPQWAAEAHPHSSCDVPLQPWSDALYTDVLQHGLMEGVLLPAREGLGALFVPGQLLAAAPQLPQAAKKARLQAPLGGVDALAERQQAGLRRLQELAGLWSLADAAAFDCEFFGDGTIFLDLVVQPLFNLMAEQVGLMGSVATEQPGSRLGYDDLNESACVPQAVRELHARLAAAQGADPWDSLLRLAVHHASSVQQECGVCEPLTPAMQSRYPRDAQRAAALEQQLQAASRAAARAGAAAAGGLTSPVCRLLGSLHTTDALWATWAKKTFVERNSMVAALITFSRVFILHVMLLVFLTLTAYFVPDIALVGSMSVFGAAFWSANGMRVAWCASWALVAHSALHTAKSVAVAVLSVPPALKRQPAPGGAAGSSRSGSGKRAAPAWRAVGTASGLRRLSVLSAAFWAACCLFLVATHVAATRRTWHRRPAWIGSGGVDASPAAPPPPWAFSAALYACIWLLYRLLSLAVHRLGPQRWSPFIAGGAWGCLGCVFPRARTHASRGVLQLLADSGVWALTLVLKVAFNFYVLNWWTTGPVLQLVAGLDDSSSSAQVFEVALLCAALWLPCALLLLHDTGLFWLVVSSAFSVLVGVHRKLGFIRSWATLVLALPHLARRLSSLMLPNASAAFVTAAEAAAAAAADWQAGVEARALSWTSIGSMSSGGHTASTPGAGTPRTPSLRRANSLPRGVVHSNSLPRSLRHAMVLPRDVPACSHALFPDEDGDTVAPTLRPPSDLSQPLSVVARGGAGPAATPAAILATQSKLQGVPLAHASEALLAQAWGKIITDLRARDLLSNLEAARLSYEVLAPAPAGQPGAWQLLPRVFAAGAAAEVVASGVSSATQVLVVCSAFNWLLWLLEGLGAISQAQLTSLVMVATAEDAQQGMQQPLRRFAFAGRSSPPGSGVSTRVAGVADVEAAAKLLANAKALLARVKAQLDDAKPAEAADIDMRLLLEAVLDDVSDMRQRLGQPRLQLSTSQLKACKADRVTKQVVAWLLDMLALTRSETTPACAEATRALLFWACSLCSPNLLPAAPVLRTPSLASLVLHTANKPVMFALSRAAVVAELAAVAGDDAQPQPAPLEQPLPQAGDDSCFFLLNSDGEATEVLKYLSVMYKREFDNFLERLLGTQSVTARLAAAGVVLPRREAITHEAFLPGGVLAPWCDELLSFCSSRCCMLLLRTIHGLMHAEVALQQLVLMQRKADLMAAALNIAAAAELPREQQDAWLEAVVDEAALVLARRQFSLVLTSDTLDPASAARGSALQRWPAFCIREIVAQRYPSLRIAFVDSAPGLAGAPLPGARDTGDMPRLPRLQQQCAVLLQWNSDAAAVAELYRVRLPVNLETDAGVLLGERPLELQTLALAFCHGQVLQTCGATQDSYFAEALKLPNLLAEFKGGPQRCSSASLVGVRNWVTTGDTGALGELTAATARSLNTMQRTSDILGGCRLPTGEQDFWDAAFVTSHGLARATPGLHQAGGSAASLAGVNLLLRGGRSVFLEHTAIGTARSTGFESIVADNERAGIGCAQQFITRDVSRLADRVDTPRLFTLFYTSPYGALFLNKSLVFAAVRAGAWALLLLMLSHTHLRSHTSPAQLVYAGALVCGVSLAHLMAVEVLLFGASSLLEEGLLAALLSLLKQLVSGSVLHFVFEGHAAAQGFLGQLQHCRPPSGGPAAGGEGALGYKLSATSFMDLYQLYARSHGRVGGRLLLLLLIALVAGLPGSSVFVLWPFAVLIVSLLLAPMIFNPFAFDWAANREAAAEFVAWLTSARPAGAARLTWRAFSERELERAGPGAARLPRLCLSLVIVAYVVSGMTDTLWRSLVLVVALNATILALLSCAHLASRMVLAPEGVRAARYTLIALKTVVLLALLTLVLMALQPQNRWLAQLAARAAVVELELGSVLATLLALAPKDTQARNLLHTLHWTGDLLLGLFLLACLFLGSLCGWMTGYQAAVLFNCGYAATYLNERRLEGTEVGRLAKELAKLEARERPQEQRAAAA